MSQRRHLVVAFCASGLLASLCLLSLGPLDVFELKTLDLRFRLREMRRYGILPANFPADGQVDPYDLDRCYWQSLWYRPPASP